ncbi:MAG: YceI family protein [Opitutaceae bacterium]|nr:YceI family protein [Opitutaceae bacterium]
MLLPRSLLLSAATLALGFTPALSTAADTYIIDASHSAVGFTVRHFFSKVPGKFNKFEGRITFDHAKPEASSVESTIQIASIDTENQKRDDHLRSPDFFDAAKFPTMTFKSTSWKKTGENTYDVIGLLTLKGVSKEVVLKVTALGFGPGMQGMQLSGWEATTTIDKKDFNMPDPALLDAALGDDVTITIHIEAGMKKKA